MLQVLSDKSPDPDALKKVVIDIISGSQRSESVKSQPASQSEEITQTKITHYHTSRLHSRRVKPCQRPQARLEQSRSTQIPSVARAPTRSDLE